MKRLLIALAITAFTSGCAGMANMSPEQRQTFFNRYQANLAAQQQQQNLLYQQQMAGINAAAANNAAHAQTNCTTSFVGTQAYTHCQ